uniref:Uncharacterized protein n=1 Tax=Oryza sativa subsp. japonica TaxID=39947 RepID=Q6ZBA6_ORYSJ|nr:hypothetical protein [Oryza sativa Japonica Group]
MPTLTLALPASIDELNQETVEERTLEAASPCRSNGASTAMARGCDSPASPATPTIVVRRHCRSSSTCARNPNPRRGGKRGRG